MKLTNSLLLVSFLVIGIIGQGCASTKKPVEESTSAGPISGPVSGPISAREFSIEDLEFFTLAPKDLLSQDKKRFPFGVDALIRGDVTEIGRFFVFDSTQKHEEIGRPVGAAGAQAIDASRSLVDLLESFSEHFCSDLNDLKLLSKTQPEFIQPASAKTVVAFRLADQPRPKSKFTFDVLKLPTGESQWRFVHFDGDPIGDGFIFRFDPKTSTLHEFVYLRDHSLYRASMKMKFDPAVSKWLPDESQAVRLALSFTKWQNEFEGSVTRNQGEAGDRMIVENRYVSREGNVARTRMSYFGEWGHVQQKPGFLIRQYGRWSDEGSTSGVLGKDREGDKYFAYKTSAALRISKKPTGVPKMMLNDFVKQNRLNDTEGVLQLSGTDITDLKLAVSANTCRPRGFKNSFVVGSDAFNATFKAEFENEVPAPVPTPAPTSKPARRR